MAVRFLVAEAMCGSSTDERSDVQRYAAVAEQLLDIPRVVLEDLALRLHRLGARRERDVAVREGATLALLRGKGNARAEGYSYEQGA